MFWNLVKKLQRSFYVDDLIMGSSNENTSYEEVLQTLKIMDQACLPLEKWKSNSASPVEKLEKANVRVSTECSSTTKVLGIPWNTHDDNLGINLPSSNKVSVLTKRKVLSLVNGIFDPLGMASPIIITLKIFLKYIWLRGYDWDEEFTLNDQSTAINILDDINNLKDVSVPRCCYPYDKFDFNRSTFRLHLFTDASEEAYAACIYLQCFDENNFSNRFLIGKTRVSPTKKMSLPRLELMGCLLGAKLIHQVLDAISPEFHKSIEHYCWVDSMIAWQWIRSSGLKYKPFVCNRI